MAYTKIHAINRTVDRAIRYISDPRKTEGKLLISGYNCAPDSAAMEFYWTQALAEQQHKAGRRSAHGPQAYHLIQSFAPSDKVDEALAHQLGQELAASLLDGQFQYVVATHVDKKHIHNHIIFCATSWLTQKKFRSKPYQTAAQIRDISDRICAAHDLSVIAYPRQMDSSYTAWRARSQKYAWRRELRKRLDYILQRATSYEAFLSMCREMEITVHDPGAHQQAWNDFCAEVEDMPPSRIDRKLVYEILEQSVSGDELSQDGAYTLNGIARAVEENSALQQRLQTAIAAQVPLSTDWRDFCQRMDTQCGIYITEGKRGLIYHFHSDGPNADPDQVVKRRENLLPRRCGKEAILRGIQAKAWPEPDADDAQEEPEPSVWAQWIKQQQQNVDYTPVTLQPEQIAKLTRRGLLVQTETDGKPCRLYLDSNYVDYDRSAGRYTVWIHPEYQYTVTSEAPGQWDKGKLRGDRLIKALARANGEQGVWVDVPASVIRWAGPNGMALHFAQEKLDVRIDPEDCRITPNRIQMQVYPHWVYGHKFRGEDLLGAISRQPEQGTPNELFRRYRTYERLRQHQQAQQLSQALRTMEREQIPNLSGFAVRREQLQEQLAAWRSQAEQLTRRREQYVMALRNLEVVRQSAQSPPNYKTRVYAEPREAALQQSNLVELARYNLRRMQLDESVEPERVERLIAELQVQERQARDELTGLEKRLRQLDRVEQVVRQVIGKPLDQDEQHEPQSSRQETKIAAERGKENSKDEMYKS